METRHRSIVSSDRLEKPGIEHLVHKASGIMNFCATEASGNEILSMFKVYTRNPDIKNTVYSLLMSQ